MFKIASNQKSHAFLPGSDTDKDSLQGDLCKRNSRPRRRRQRQQSDLAFFLEGNDSMASTASTSTCNSLGDSSNSISLLEEQPAAQQQSKAQLGSMTLMSVLPESREVKTHHAAGDRRRHRTRRRRQHADCLTIQAWQQQTVVEETQTMTRTTTTTIVALVSDRPAERRARDARTSKPSLKAPSKSRSPTSAIPNSDSSSGRPGNARKPGARGNNKPRRWGSSKIHPAAM
eukprot:CAMPEP_0198115216 /NCGR_PEP_ID=MMETSP1442-20131203/6383_1 /TAXON_ID= /ORGANISM="Craspedostauros australis, Strain CCMP3328" /LENGTH=229 /DNA_ID=CAMNT_0043772683 /DNA_START=188 /DNA_END=877 /DNA_ORIENTATION=+